MARGRWLAASVVLAWFAVPSAGLAQAPPAPAPTASPDFAAVAKVADALIEALDAADLERFTSLFAPDATMFFPLAPLTDRLENKEQITKVFGAFFESVRRGKSGPPYMTLVPQDARIQLYGSAAIVSFHFQGPDLVSRRTLVLRKDGGKWLIVHMHASGIPVQKP